MKTICAYWFVAMALSCQVMAQDYSINISGRQAGYQSVRVLPSKIIQVHFEYNDRERGPVFDGEYGLTSQGLLASVHTTGVDYYKKTFSESFSIKSGIAKWSNPSESGEAAAKNLFYVPKAGTSEELAILAHALKSAPKERLKLLPSGEASLEHFGDLTIAQGEKTRTVALVAISGLNFEATPIWLNTDGTLFAQDDGWIGVIEKGWESSLAELLTNQNKFLAQKRREVAKNLAHSPLDKLAITHVNVFDSLNSQILKDMTVLIAKNIIESVTSADKVTIPPLTEVIDGKGKTLLPGLWDMHVHLGNASGMLNIANGVTSVRDLGNKIELVLEYQKAYSTGKEIGPRVILAGLIDGKGPTAAPVETLVDNQEEAEAAVDRYFSLGYEQIKIYSSLPPKLVPIVIARAKFHKLRVSGHIPAFMNAEQAVNLGFDEIQHTNMLFLNFMRDVQDTRGMERFHAVGRRAVTIDLDGEAVSDFIKLLERRKIVIDPTLAAFEKMYSARPGSIPSGWTEVFASLPAQVRRDLLSGGIAFPKDMELNYRKTPEAMLRLVRKLYDSNVTLVAGTDDMEGFALHRELELYSLAGIPNEKVLQIATLNGAKVMHRESTLGSITAGKLADLVLVDGDPVAKMSDIRKIDLVIKDGAVFHSSALKKSLGITP